MTVEGPVDWQRYPLVPSILAIDECSRGEPGSFRTGYRYSGSLVCLEIQDLSGSQRALKDPSRGNSRPLALLRDYAALKYNWYLPAVRLQESSKGPEDPCSDLVVAYSYQKASQASNRISHEQYALHEVILQCRHSLP